MIGMLEVYTVLAFFFTATVHFLAQEFMLMWKGKMFTVLEGEEHKAGSVIKFESGKFKEFLSLNGVLLFESLAVGVFGFMLVLVLLAVVELISIINTTAVIVVLSVIAFKAIAFVIAKRAIQ